MAPVKRWSLHDKELKSQILRTAKIAAKAHNRHDRRQRTKPNTLVKRFEGRYQDETALLLRV